MGNQPASEAPDPYGARPSARDMYELLRLPALFAFITAVLTWLIWYYTSIPCSLELAERTGCNAATIARYINVDIYGRMLTYSAITGAAGGVWNYDMFTKMRAAIAAERSRADEAEKRLAEYRRQAEEDRRQAEEERRQVEQERRQAEEQERRQAEQDRQQERETLMAMLAEHRRRADESQQAFMTALSELTAQMTRLVDQQNGNGRSEH